MNILLDTNVILDTFLGREPHNNYSDTIFELIADNKIFGYVNASSVTDIYYVLRKKFSDKDSREKIRTLLTLFYTIDVTKTDLLAALDSPIVDFEDALVSACVDKAGLDFTVTRDTEFLKNEKTIAPNKFLEMFFCTE